MANLLCFDCGKYHSDGGCDLRLSRQIMPTTVMKPDELTPSSFESLVAAYMKDHVFARRFCECIEIIRKKNADYSQGEQKGDRIAGFRKIAADMELPMRKVWGVFFSKHMQAIKKFLKDGYVESEPIDQRINDAINYLVLLGPIIEEMKADRDVEE